MQDITVLDGGMGRELARMGAPFRQPEWSALALLFNCSQPEAMGAATETAQRTLASAGTPLVIGAYANAFPPQRADARANEELHGLRGDIDPPGYAGWAGQWLALGARIVGGCCGIGPGHIAALRDAVDARGAAHTGFGQ